MVKITYLIATTIASGIAYRLGGIGKPFNTKHRDLVVPAFVLATFYLWTQQFEFWPYFFSYGLLFAALTTYCKFITRLLKKDDSDVYWYNWLCTGVFYGLSALPLMVLEVPLFLILARTAALGVMTMLWSEAADDPFWEEFGRGALVTLTIPILTI